MILALLPAGEVDEKILEFLKNELEKRLNLNVIVLENIPLPDMDAERGQYKSDSFLRAAGKYNFDRILVITCVDIFTDGMNFIFGQAFGRNAVLSIYRLKDNNLILKEALHELGHKFGLSHCKNCIMEFSNSLEEAMAKPSEFCLTCKEKAGKFLK